MVLRQILGFLNDSSGISGIFIVIFFQTKIYLKNLPFLFRCFTLCIFALLIQNKQKFLRFILLIQYTKFRFWY